MEETKTYELGFLLTPLLTEEGVTGFLAGAFKQLLERHNAVITVAETHKLIPLAYVIRKRIENKNQVFREAYFGSVRFTAAPEAIPALTDDLRKLNEVVRYLVVIIPKGADIVVARRLITTAAAPQPAVELPPSEAIDKEIDQLLTI